MQIIPAVRSHAELLGARLPAYVVGKWHGLLHELTSFGSAIVALSGGVDSALLAVAAFLALEDKMLAVTVQTCLETPEDIESARCTGTEVGLPFEVIVVDMLTHPQIVANPPDRCYWCKREILDLLSRMAARDGFACVLEGQNADDMTDYRPGRMAIAETGTHSPLADQGLTKAEIRNLAHALELSCWDRPSSPCLATRIAFGERLTPDGLARVRDAEAYLHNLGFRIVRVRSRGFDARIEVPQEDLERLFDQRLSVCEVLRGLGYLNVSIDLMRQRMGSLGAEVRK